MRKSVAIIILLALITSYSFHVRHRLIQSTKAKLKEQSSKLSNIRKMQTEMKTQPLLRPNLEKMQQLREARSKLIKLRGEHTLLSRTKDWTMEELEDSIGVIAQNSQIIEEEIAYIHQMDQARKKTKQVLNTMGAFQYAILRLRQHGFNPSSLREARQQIADLPKSLEGLDWVQRSFEGTNENQTTSWKDYELVSIALSSPPPLEYEFLTEKKARVLPDGALSKWYLEIYERHGPKEILAFPEEFDQEEKKFWDNLPHSLQNQNLSKETIENHPYVLWKELIEN
jgi:hypothetical protein